MDKSTKYYLFISLKQNAELVALSDKLESRSGLLVVFYITLSAHISSIATYV